MLGDISKACYDIFSKLAFVLLTLVGINLVFVLSIGDAEKLLPICFD